MKKYIVFAAIIFFTVSVSGQEPADYLMKARALASEGKTDAALSELSGAILSMNDHRLYLERAEVNILKGDYSAAINDFNEANKITPFSGEYGLSRIYSLKGDARTSLYHLEMNINSTFRKSEKEIMLDPAFGTIENKPEWRLFWRKDRYSELERKVSEIEFYTSSGKSDESQQLLLDLKSTYGNSDETAYAETLVDLSTGKTTEAVRILTALNEANPGNEKFLRTLAKAQESASNPAGASVTYSKIIDLGIADAGLLVSRSECYRKTGENEKALADIEKYLGFYPGNKTALSLAGKVEAVSGDNLKAIEFFSKNLELHPNDADCYVDRGNSYLVSKSWKWAILDYSMSLDLKPGNSDVWLNKGIALLSSGNREDACHDFRKSLSLGNRKASEYISRNCIK